MHRSFCWGGAAARLVALVATLAAVAGCSANENAAITCPSTDIIGPVGSVSRFGVPTGSFAQLAYRASFTNIHGTCDIDDDGVTVKVSVTILAEAGPAATATSADFPYFVAVLDPRQRIIAKQVLTDTISFGGSQHRGGATDTFDQRIPLRNPKLASDYHVFVGFQLTPDELAYNRTHSIPH
jgi:hypothetical protein